MNRNIAAVVLISVLLLAPIACNRHNEATAAAREALQKRIELEATFTEYSDFLRHGDFKGAYALTSTEFQGVTSFEDFRKIFVQVGELSAIDRAGIRVTGEGSMANLKGLVQADFRFGQGRSVTILHQFILEGGRWRLLGMKRM